MYSSGNAWTLALKMRETSHFDGPVASTYLAETAPYVRSRLGCRCRPYQHHPPGSTPPWGRRCAALRSRWWMMGSAWPETWRNCSARQHTCAVCSRSVQASERLRLWQVGEGRLVVTQRQRNLRRCGFRASLLHGMDLAFVIVEGNSRAAMAHAHASCRCQNVMTAPLSRLMVIVRHHEAWRTCAIATIVPLSLCQSARAACRTHHRQ
jgi:hypothetical protein